jgi:hypothetical protein
MDEPRIYLRYPKCRAIQMESGTLRNRVELYVVSIQLAWSWETPKVPAISGSTRFTAS